jgi:beta-lysine 5,6-aminomutase alpha subunit
MTSKLNLDKEKIARARELAATITAPVTAYIEGHTTVTVERATLRALGADGADPEGVPVPNLIVASLGEGMDQGAAFAYVNALVRTGATVARLNERIASGLDISKIPASDSAAIQQKAESLLASFSRRVADNATQRTQKIEAFLENEKSPLLYLIVATGNIHEDAVQAKAAAEQGADVVAVIRSTAQSLLDYVPFGATTEGFGGTFATQENFRIMRAALDEVSLSEKRYIRLVNYASGLCMPEIAVMGALERLDMMLNDSMYGILFRDINMYRTFVDQHFSRMINAFAGITINTGEDNYLTTSDAYEKAHTVLASQLINERLALAAGLPPRLIGLGHAFEMDPAMENGFLFEIAQAEMAREIFPECPLKYMPPTKFMTGNIFKGYAMNTLFNFASKLTNQGIHLLGMLTEAIHTPFVQDRFLAVQNARYVMQNTAGLRDEIEFKADGLIVGRARRVLGEAISFLEELAKGDLFDALEAGHFAETVRRKSGGKGQEGVVPKAPGYWNPVMDHLAEALGLDTHAKEVSHVG